MADMASPAMMETFGYFVKSTARSKGRLGEDAKRIAALCPKGSSVGDFKRELLRQLEGNILSIQDGALVRARLARLEDVYYGPTSGFTECTETGGWMSIGNGAHMRRTFTTH